MLNIKTVLCRADTMDNYSYIIYSDDKSVCAVIDPSEALPIINALNQLNLKPQFILNTHHHFDHTDANIELKQLYQSHVIGNINDAPRIPEFDIGVIPNKFYQLSPQGLLDLTSPNESSLTFQVIDVSAHTQGHILYYFPKDKILLSRLL